MVAPKAKSKLRIIKKIFLQVLHLLAQVLCYHNGSVVGIEDVLDLQFLGFRLFAEPVDWSSR